MREIGSRAWRRVGRSMFTIALLIAGLGVANPSQAASTGAGAYILNVVKVTYKDASGSSTFNKSASATVFVALTAAQATNTTTDVPQSVVSGAIAVYNTLVYSNANGSDSYTISLAQGATTNAVAGTVDLDFYVTDPTGAVSAVYNTTDTPSITIDSTVILSNVGNVLSIPYNSALNIANGDNVVVNGVIYNVTAVTAGAAPTHNTGTYDRTAETHATITIDASPAFTDGALAGAVISEAYGIEVRVTAIADSLLGDASVAFDLGVQNSSGTATVSRTTTFLRSDVTVTKGASVANAAPGDIIEYTVTIVVAGADATSVAVTDAVPEFTTLVTYAADYTGAQTTGSLDTYFAQIGDGTTTDTTISSASDSETAANIGSGNAAGYAAGSALSFYLGAGSNATTGGTIAAGTTFTIKYRVKVD